MNGKRKTEVGKWKILTSVLPSVFRVRVCRFVSIIARKTENGKSFKDLKKNRTYPFQDSKIHLRYFKIKVKVWVNKNIRVIKLSISIVEGILKLTRLIVKMYLLSTCGINLCRFLRGHNKFPSSVFHFGKWKKFKNSWKKPVNGKRKMENGNFFSGHLKKMSEMTQNFHFPFSVFRFPFNYGRPNGWMDEWINGQMDKWMNG